MVTKPRWYSLYDVLKAINEGTHAPITYEQTSQILYVKDGKPAARRHLGGMLRKVYDKCLADGTPDLTTMVVKYHTRQPGSSWPGWAAGVDPEEERRRAHEYFRVQRFGK